MRQLTPTSGCPAALSARVECALVWLTALLVVAGFAVCVQPECFPTDDQRLVKRVLALLEARHEGAYPLACELMTRPGSGPFAIALAAEAAATRFESESAIDLYRKLPADGGQWEILAQLGLARRCDVLGRLTDEERHLRRVLELAPDHLEANLRLGDLLQVSGRSWEAAPYFLTLIRLGKCRGDELVGLAAPERFFRQDPQRETLGLNANPPDPLCQLSLARRLLFDNHQAEGEALLRQIIDAAPHLAEAQGRLGRIIYDRGDAAEFFQWRGSLPNQARQHPEVWFVQGLQARRLGQIEGAVRCFLECLTLSPHHLGASMQVATCLDQLNKPDLARTFVRHGEEVAKLESLLNLVRNEPTPGVIHQISQSMADRGRFWEAAGWTHVVLQLGSDSPGQDRVDLRRWLRQALRDPHPLAAEFNPVAPLRLADFAEPRWSGPAAPQVSSEPVQRGDQTWEFQDDAERAGIAFRYFEGTTEERRLEHIFNVVGGGLAATDYDRDGWCDLYLAQANDWHNPMPQPDSPDRLYRNLPDGKFREVTEQAGLGELGFSHGVAAGDFDQDGFDDLYVGNLGPNRLYHNNGDGTFTEIAADAAVAGNEWTTSSTFADFSGDGLPDLYVANYALSDEARNKICRRSSGEQIACTPDVLTAEFHRLYLNRGDGSFRDVTHESGMRQPNGRGLGLVAWDFAGDGRLGLFVANDTSANFMYINTGPGADGIPTFREEAVVRGVAFDLDGNSTASMGVAAGDANGDGLLDMFITNFFAESNSLYLQRPDGLFGDATRLFALRDPGYWMLGFGTQFADFDGDGWEDLIVTNGHVDQRSHRGDPDRMPPQLFHNRQGTRFDEIAPERLGSFFQQGHLGRGLARLDWNRDGQVDFAVSHLHEPFSLITNKTPSSGRPLLVRLAGRTGSRDPTGARVTVRAGKRSLTRLVTAGDGYLVTNERFVQFAVPRDLATVELEVHWPGGEIDQWKDVAPDQEIQLIEGRSAPVVLRQYAE